MIRSTDILGCWLSVVLVLQVAPIIEPNVIPLEAAFQGRCEDGNPCAQHCFNIHNEMFECDCKQGFKLSDNGYSCLKIDSNSTKDPADGGGSKLALQIDVDIDPPADEAQASGGHSEKTPKTLGLPSHHVRFTAVSSDPSNGVGQAVPRDPTEELLTPEDIKITYSEGDPISSSSASTSSPHYEKSSSHRSFPALAAQDGNLESNEEKEPPRALPWTERRPVDNQQMLADKVMELDVVCNLECGSEGECVMQKQVQTNVILKRCLCPAGKNGPKCALDDTSVTVPHFSGLSYMVLPTLTNAYSDLQLSLEFKPESPNGILLLTGETADMTGDYLTLLLRDGHVELRLDCGTGPGVVTSTGSIQMGQWNRLTVFRHDWGVWLQLNGGFHEEGRSQGLFSRITFAQPLTIGGVGHFKNAKHFLDMDVGYVGCIRHLEINNKMYNFNSASKTSDTIAGRDITQCTPSEDDCDLIQCLHQGSCFSQNGKPFCKCVLGFEGTFCERPVEIEVPYFAGGSEETASHLTFSGLGQSSLLWNQFELVLRAQNEDGLILYNGNSDGFDFNRDNDDFIAVYLSRGFVNFAFNAGDGVTMVRSQKPIRLNEWHSVRISRTGLLAEVSVDSQKRMFQMGVGSFTQVSLRQHLYIGGVPSFDFVSPFIPIRTAFHGCIQRLSINDAEVPIIQSAMGGLNVAKCLSHPCSTNPSTAVPPCGWHGSCKPQLNNFTCECPLGRTGDRCENTFEVDTNAKLAPSLAPAFSGDSFLHFKDSEMAKQIIGNTNSINLRVKVASPDGLIFWTGGDPVSPSSDFLLLGVRNGFLEFRFNLGNGQGIVVANYSRIDDNKWHRIRATRTEQTASLRLDNGHVVTGASPGKLRQLNGNGHIYLGGTEDLAHLPVPEFRTSLVGCVEQMSLGKMFDINLLQTATDGRNVNQCQADFVVPDNSA